VRKFCKILSAPFLLLLAVSALSQGSQAQVVQDRIAEPVDSASMATLPGTLHPLAKPEFEQGLADNSKVLQGLSINFKRTSAQEAALKALLQAQQDPASPSYHKWLTQAQFGQQFGMSQADLDKVSAWLQQEGFTINFTAQSNNAIHFSGSIASVEKAFQTQIHNYTVNGEQHYANSTQISIPTALAGLVSNVRGLDDFRPAPRIRFARSRQSTSNPHFTSGVTGAHYLTPPDFATIYDLGPLYSAGDTGKGITIAVMGQTDIVLADITDFRSASGLSVNNPTVFTVPGTTPESVAVGESNDDLAETDLDLEWSGGVATGASIVLVNSDSVFDSLQYAIEEPINGITVPIISQSYGSCEANYSTANIAQIEGELEQANGQGQTVVLAAGDTGAADCDDSATQIITAASLGLAVDYPGSSAYVTDAGGSEFMGDGTAAAPQTGSGTYWSANGSNDLVSSAKSYIPEMAWNDTTFNISVGGGLDGGGGGASALFPKPTWQTGVPGIPADSARDVPDISLDASNDHDGLIYCTQVEPSNSSTFVSSCQATSFRTPNVPSTNDGNLLAIAGGTSFAAPEFSGILAIIEQKLASSGGLGNIDPALYKLASNATTYASAFHDIKSGNNQVPCVSGSPDCPSGSNPVIGYAAGTGYDQATGLGSIDANNLATAFAALVAATGTKTTLAVTPGASLAIGESATFTATVTPNTVSTAPTGTVTFIVDGLAKTAPTLSTASPYTATYTTNFATSGKHTVYVTYSGDSTYTQSTSSIVSVAVVSQGTQPTTTAVVASPTTVALGGSLTLTATITATTAGTLTGPVTFTTAGTTIGTVKQVTLATGDTATAVLTVSAATASLGFVAGTDTITATYGGDSYNATSTGTTTVTVTNPGITVSATNITISSSAPGNSGTSTITLTSTGGYSGTANVSASSSTLNADAGFGSSGAQTASIALSSGGTGSTTLTITTVAATGNFKKRMVADIRKNAGRIAAAGGTAAGSLLLLFIPGIRRKRWPAALIMLVFLSVGAGLGCGGGTGGGSPGGTYTVTVTATDSSSSAITGSGSFTVTIQ
jgi:Pro-kumamolisin, activation domain/Bacterial Ig-like domain (group 3)